MHQNFTSLIRILVILAILISACDNGQPSGEDTAMISIPVEYAGKINPVSESVEALTEGKSIYDSACSSCHGNTGFGDGPASASLTPPPANLVDLNRTVNDDILFWRISDGKNGTSIVGWKTTYSDYQIWQMISYIRTFE